MREKVLRWAVGVTLVSVLILAAGASAGAQMSSSRFYFGVDLSYTNEMEDCGAIYRENGQARDPFELFAERGATLVRARLWNDPDWTAYSTLDDVKRTFARAGGGHGDADRFSLLRQLGRPGAAGGPGGVGRSQRRRTGGRAVRLHGGRAGGAARGRPDAGLRADRQRDVVLPAVLALRIVFFGGGALALIAAGHTTAGVAFAAISAANVALIYVWRQDKTLLAG